MAHKIGLKLWSINTDHYYDEAQKLYQEAVFDYIELYVVPNSLHTLDKWAKLDVPFIIHNPHFAHGFNLAKKEKEESNIFIYNETKEFADILKAPYIIFHGGIDGNIEESARQLKNLNEKRALIENKPFVAIPNKMGGEFCRGYNVEEIQHIIDGLGCGFCFDFGHAVCSANSQGIDVYDYCKSFLPLEPIMFHLTDVDDISSPYDTHKHLGEGQLDIEKIKAMISSNAIITLETDKNSKENLDDFVGDVEFWRGQQVTIRQVRSEDINFVFELANEDIVRKTAFTQEAILWENHIKWFENQIRNKYPFYIIAKNNISCGYIRFQPYNNAPDTLLLTIALTPESRGRKIGQISLKKACEHVFSERVIQKIIALVKHENSSSARLFLNCNFLESTYNNKYREFHYINK